jgi:hypothetical protein
MGQKYIQVLPMNHVTVWQTRKTNKNYSHDEIQSQKKKHVIT